MVLDHVTQGSDRIVERPAVVDAEVLGHRHVDAGHVVTIPHWLEQRVGKAQVGDVRDRLLAQKVIDAQDLMLMRAPRGVVR